MSRSVLNIVLISCSLMVATLMALADLVESSSSIHLSVIWVTETVTSQAVLDPSTATQIKLDISASSSQPVVSLPSTIPSSPGIPSLEVQLPHTVIEVVTETEIVTMSATQPPSSTTVSPMETLWSAPAQMTDLSAFNILAFAGGKKNLDIVTGIPASASATSLDAESTNLPEAWDNSSSVLQLLYPAHSINPGRRLQGGAQFYATPLEIANATSVALEYSVFFPVDFDWVLAGKLPGLYGGHEGCSGGNDALNCFSTRLMWRRRGYGELYLYAPKNKQTRALCSDPQSVCGARYGLSIGRGSFRWARGVWTTVRQSVVLNTPGMQDGVFTLDVDGRRVIERSDVYYRGRPLDGDHDGTHKPTKTKKPSGGGLLDGLGSLVGGILGLEGMTLPAEHHTDYRGAGVGECTVTETPAYQAQLGWSIDGAYVEDPTAVKDDAMSIRNGMGTLGTKSAPRFPTPTPITQQLIKRTAKPVGFTGLFFSTFFGGHDIEYETPRDQYVWFKGFAISKNN